MNFCAFVMSHIPFAGWKEKGSASISQKELKKIHTNEEKVVVAVEGHEHTSGLVDGDGLEVRPIHRRFGERGRSPWEPTSPGPSCRTSREESTCQRRMWPSSPAEATTRVVMRRPVGVEDGHGVSAC